MPNKLFKNKWLSFVFLSFIFILFSDSVLAQMSTPNAGTVVTNGTVRTIATDGSGTIYLGGDFTTVGGVTRNRIAAIDSSGALTSWNPNANSVVSSIAVNGSTVYVGGFFTNIGGQGRSRIAALDTTTGNATAWNPASDDVVSALVVNGSTIYAGGDFTNIGGQARNRIAALDSTSGNATAWNPNSNGSIITLALSGTTLYAGGIFGLIGGQGRSNIAALDTTVNTNNATSWNPNALGASVKSIVLNGSTVYVGGSFAAIGGQARNNIAALDANTNTNNATNWDPNADATVNALVFNGTTVYAGGAFTSIGGQTRNQIASLDSTVNTNNATNWNPNADNTVSAISVTSSSVFIGGSFSTIGGSSRTNFAQFNQPTVSLGASPTTISESGGVSTVTATLSGASSQDVTVNLTFGGTATNITNYTRSSTVILIPAGSTTGTMTITGVNDGRYNNDLTVIPTLGSITNATAGSPSSDIITITNVNPAPSAALSVDTASISENGGVATVTATLSTVSGLNTRVNFSFGGTAVDGVNYTPSGSFILIPAGFLTGTISVTGINEGLYHNPNLTVIPTISSVVNGTAGSPSSVTITLLNVNTKPTVTLSVFPTSIATNGGTATVTATLSTASGVDTTMNLSFSGTAVLTTDYTASANSITILAGGTTGTITLTRISSPTVGSDLTATTTISSVVDSNATIGMPNSVTVTLNNSTPTLSINNVTALESAGTMTFTATLSAASSDTVTVDYATANGTALAGVNYTATSGTLTFNPGTTTQSIIVPILNSSFGEGNSKTFTVTLSNPTHATLAMNVGTGTIPGVNGGGTVEISVVGGNSVTVGSAGAVLTLNSTSTLPNSSYSWMISSTTAQDLSEAGFLTQSNEATAFYHILPNAPTQTVTIILTVIGGTASVGAKFDPDRKVESIVSTATATTQIEINGTGAIKGGGLGCSMIETKTSNGWISILSLFFPIFIFTKRRRKNATLP